MEELKDMCRVCMAESEILVDIYGKENTHVDDRLSEALKKSDEPEPTLPDLLKQCSPICVEADDPFPKKVCDPCLRRLRDAVFFHRRYSKSMEYIGRVKLENKDQAMISELEMEEWDLKPIKSENEEEEEEEVDEDQEEMENEDDEYEEKEEDLDDFEDDEEEYVPKGKKQKIKPGSFQCPDCPKTFTTNAQLVIHSGDHSKESTKQNGTSTRPKRRTAKY